MNLFADMGAQPDDAACPASSAATKSTDTTAPTATITSPPATIADGTQVTLTRHRHRHGGGVVAGVEVSTDGGTTWHPGHRHDQLDLHVGRPRQPDRHDQGPRDRRQRQRQAPGRRRAPSTSTAPARSGATSVTPARRRLPATRRPVEVGVKFKSDTLRARSSGVRFYKAAANTGTHTGSLWTAERPAPRAGDVHRRDRDRAGRPSRSPTRSRCMPDTTYVASYFAPNGHYAATADYFWRAPAPGPHGGAIARRRAAARAHATRAPTTNGVYAYSATSTFPSSAYRRRQLLGRRDSSRRRGARAASPTSRRPRAARLGERHLDGARRAAARRPRTRSPRTSAPSPRRRRPITGTPPQTSATVTGPHAPARPTRSACRRSTRTAPAPVSAASNAVTAARAGRPVGADRRRRREPALGGGARELDGARAPTAAAPITGYTVTPYIGATAQTPVSAGGRRRRAMTVTGLTNGTTYTFTVARRNAIGIEPTSAPSAAVTPQSDDLRLRRPRRSPTAATAARSSSA